MHWLLIKYISRNHRVMLRYILQINVCQHEHQQLEKEDINEQIKQTLKRNIVITR